MEELPEWAQNQQEQVRLGLLSPCRVHIQIGNPWSLNPVYMESYHRWGSSIVLTLLAMKIESLGIAIECMKLTECALEIFKFLCVFPVSVLLSALSPSLVLACLGCLHCFDCLDLLDCLDYLGPRWGRRKVCIADIGGQTLSDLSFGQKELGSKVLIWEGLGTFQCPLVPLGLFSAFWSFLHYALHQAGNNPIKKRFSFWKDFIPKTFFS